MKIKRVYFSKTLSIDSSALPCPICRSTSIKEESHPATGQISTCQKCGARSPTKKWNDGIIQMQKTEGTTNYHYITPEQIIKRPPIDEIEIKKGC